MPKNWKGGPLGFLNTQSVVKHQRNWRGGLWRKKLEKKVSQCRKTGRGTLWGFSTPIVAKHQKTEGGTLIIGEKSHNAEKNWKREALWDFPTSILTQNSKKIEGGPFGGKIFRKSLAVPKKNWKGGPFGLARYGTLRGKTGKTFLVQLARPNSANWCNNIL